jgi:hypothetical protein
LQLLKGDAETIPNDCLAQSELDSPRSQALSDMLVHGVGGVVT